MSGEQVNTKNSSEKKNSVPYKGIFLVVALLIVAGATILIPIQCGKGAGEVIKAGGNASAEVIKAGGNATADATCKIFDKINEILSSKEKTTALLGSIVSDGRPRRLQFFQRNQVCLFRLIRYKGQDYKTYDYSDSYKLESDKKNISELKVLANQYCEWEGKCTYEFNYYVDMSDLSKWEYKWERGETVASSVLTLYPPDIGANTPAELEPPIFRCIADSLTINEGYTKERLIEAMPDLKVKLAEDQKHFMYDEARSAIAEHYRNFFKLIPQFREITEFPQIKVVFPYEKEFDSKKL